MILGEVRDRLDGTNGVLAGQDEGRRTFQLVLEPLDALLLEHDVDEGVLGDQDAATFGPDLRPEGVQVSCAQPLVINEEESRRVLEQAAQLFHRRDISRVGHLHLSVNEKLSSLFREQPRSAVRLGRIFKPGWPLLSPTPVVPCGEPQLRTGMPYGPGGSTPPENYQRPTLTDGPMVEVR